MLTGRFIREGALLTSVTLASLAAASAAGTVAIVAPPTAMVLANRRYQASVQTAIAARTGDNAKIDGVLEARRVTLQSTIKAPSTPGQGGNR